MPNFPSPGQGSIIPQLCVGCFSAVLRRTPHSALQTRVSFHKNLVLHIPAHVPGYVAMAISVRLRWLSVIEDYGICSPTLGFLDSAFQLSCITFLSGSVQLCVSHSHCVTLHISAGKHKISRRRNPWCVRVLFPLLVRKERRIKDKQKSREPY